MHIELGKDRNTCLNYILHRDAILISSTCDSKLEDDLADLNQAHIRIEDARPIYYVVKKGVLPKHSLKKTFYSKHIGVLS